MELILVGIAVAAIWWAQDRRRHPLRKCRTCKGSGKKRSAWSSSAYGTCGRCGGKGEVSR